MTLAPQTELHRHLDVSVRPATLLELAKERGLEAQSTSLAAFRDKIILQKPLGDLAAVLDRFELFPKIFDRPEIFERVGFETVEDCHGEGTRFVELRFSPGFVCGQDGKKWQAALDGFKNGLNRAMAKYPAIRAGLICIATRDYGPDSAHATVEFFLRNREAFVGLDLAGNEDQFPCHLFEAAFRPAIAAGAKITIHAGEASGPENIWEAIELLGARRIGHGIACVRDPKLMRVLAEEKICLEVCPTSNWLTHATESLEAHPLPKILRAGVPACINTDDPGVFGVTLGEEYEVARSRMGLTAEELANCRQNAYDFRFVN